MSKTQTKILRIAVAGQQSIHRAKMKLVSKLKDTQGSEYVSTGMLITICVVLGTIALGALIVFLKEKYFPKMENTILDTYSYS